MTAPEHQDVVIIGAGIAGIDMAYRLQTTCPDKTYAVLEGRERMGGTWDLFRYPGIRSDSDMYTLAFPFEPWTHTKAIADGDDILDYIETTAAKHGIDDHIHFGHKVLRAEWSSDDARWSLLVETDGQERQLTASFLYVGAGYYRYDTAYTPDFPGAADFTGEVVHPQFWPEDIDIEGRRFVIIGSGATAMTLAPALASRGAQVTMLQRSPSYVLSRPSKDALAHGLRKVVSDQRAHDVVRWKNAALTLGMYHFCRRMPRLSDLILRTGVGLGLRGKEKLYPHFTPRYAPWDQRLCIVPDSDLFREIRSGRVRVVTDTIDRFSADGIRVSSGEVLEADVIVTATGLDAAVGGGIDLTVDGEKVDIGERLVYRGLMLDGVPNAGFGIGYTNASWTLRVDMSARYACRLIRHLDEGDYAYGVPVPPEGVEVHDSFDLSSGYIQRARGSFPKSGSEAPWLVRHNFFADRKEMRRAQVEEHMRFVRVDDLPAEDEAATEKVPESVP